MTPIPVTLLDCLSYSKERKITNEIANVKIILENTKFKNHANGTTHSPKIELSHWEKPWQSSLLTCHFFKTFLSNVRALGVA